MSTAALIAMFVPMRLLRDANRPIFVIDPIVKRVQPMRLMPVLIIGTISYSLCGGVTFAALVTETFEPFKDIGAYATKWLRLCIGATVAMLVPLVMAALAAGLATRRTSNRSISLFLKALVAISPVFLVLLILWGCARSFAAWASPGFDLFIRAPEWSGFMVWRILGGSFSLYTIVLMNLFMSMLLYVRLIAWAESGRVLCLWCGYDLAGTPERRICPECGRDRMTIGRGS